MFWLQPNLKFHSESAHQQREKKQQEQCEDGEHKTGGLGGCRTKETSTFMKTILALIPEKVRTMVH